LNADYLIKSARYIQVRIKRFALSTGR
jgi:hypothetical protein